MRGATRRHWQPEVSWFWSRVNKNGPKVRYVRGRCWNWNRTLGYPGYGMVRRTKAPERKVYATLTAHRVSWEFTNGTIPEGMLVLHRCDNRACVRPTHLFLGTDQDNVDDMFAKGRGHKSHGEKHHLSKLTAAKVRQIRKERAKDPPTHYKVLAQRYGTTIPAVRYAAIRHTWKHVE